MGNLLGTTVKSKPNLLVVAEVALLIALISGCSQSAIGNMDVEAIAAQTTPFQRQILEDGKVTGDEYANAVLSSRDCVRAAGGQVGEIEQRPGNQLGFETTVESPDESGARKIADAINNCNT